MNISSYKYKFKQINVQALDLFLMYSCEFLLCCCSYTSEESEKQTYLCRTIELSDSDTSGLSEYQTVGLTGYRIIATLPS